MEKIKKKMGRKPGPKPHLWVSGPDPVVHSYFNVFVQHRNQCNFRNEPYELSFDQWFDLWGDKITKRGRTSGCYIMTRIDSKLPWTYNNVMVKQR